jgi:hypothetical protein
VRERGLADLPGAQDPDDSKRAQQPPDLRNAFPSRDDHAQETTMKSQRLTLDFHW